MVNKLYKFRSLFQKFATIRRKIRSLDISVSTYLAIWTYKDKLHIAELGGESVAIHKDLDRERNIAIMVIAWIQRREITHNIKVIASEIIGEKWLHPIISDLWLKEDVVPYFVESSKFPKSQLQKGYVQEIASRFNEEGIMKVPLSYDNEVEIAELVTLEDYRKITNIDEFTLLLALAKKFNGKKIVFINATPQGGGVALMRHALIRLYKLLGVDAHWHVLYPMKEVFDITKDKFHNVLQAVASPDTFLTEEDKKLYISWTAENADQLKKSFSDADVIVIDDPQPAGLVPYIKKQNPNGKIIYRSHIQIESHLADKKGTPQFNTWQFIWNHIKDMDLFVSHPIKKFIPANVPLKKTVMMPATTDGLDGLNKPLTPRQTDYYLKVFDKILLENDESPLDRTRPFIVQISRFDPSKGIPDVIESYRMLCQKLEQEKRIIPQLVIVGHGSIDDPDGVPIYNLIMDMLRSKKYQHLSMDVKVARLPAIDQLLNVLMREAKVALQLSHKEGFEVKISEALMKGIPIIAYRAGGIPLQIKDGVSGFLVDVGNTETVANRLHKLFTNDEFYHTMRKAALENVIPETTTVSNAINWLYLAHGLTKKGKIDGDGKNVKELIQKEFSE